MLYCMFCFFVFFLQSFDLHVVFINWPWTIHGLAQQTNQCNESQVVASAGVTLSISESVGEDARMAGAIYLFIAI